MTSDVAFKRIEPEEFFNQHFDQGVRPDGRSSLLAIRPVSISVGSIGTADGSSVVRQGQTVVTCGVKLELAEPKAETPNQGFIVPNIELGGICHSQFKSGPPSEEAQTLSQFLFEVIRNSKMLDAKDLVIVEGKLVWVVYIDLVCLNYGGNVADASVKALVGALKNVKLPKIERIENEDSGSVSIKSWPSVTTPLKLGHFPISCSIAIFKDKLLNDPTEEEESFASSKVTIVLVASPDQKSFELCHILKHGGKPIDASTLQKCISTAKQQAKAIKKLTEKYTD